MVKILKQSHELMAVTPDLTRVIEAGARVCYKSEEKTGIGTDAALIARLMESKHESVLEHGAITCRFITDRGVTHELVRHRIASFSQESTRYCNYGKDKFGKEITIVLPIEFYEVHETEIPQRHLVHGDDLTNQYYSWLNGMRFAEQAYFRMLDHGSKPQLARDVLPNSLKTEIVVTANPREWRHIFRLRTSKFAHPQIRALMFPFLYEMVEAYPPLFMDLV